MMGTEAEYTFRPYTEDDIPFIHSSWGSSYYRGSDAYKGTTPQEFHAFHRPIRDRFLKRPTATVICCVNPEDAWHIIGWAAVEIIPSAMILHYIYVKEVFKGKGIAKELLLRALPTNPVLFTHLTEKAAKIMSSHYQEFGKYRHIPHLV